MSWGGQSVGILALAVATAGCDSCGSKATTGDSDSATSTDAAAPVASAPLNATPIPSASIAAVVNPQNLPAYTGPTGSIEGTVSVVGPPAPETPADFHQCPDAAKTWDHAFREGQPIPGSKGARALADTFVYVTGYSGFYLPETKEAEELLIERCSPRSRSVTMTFGQRLEVKNLTKEFWTPILEPDPKMVMMMAPPNGDPIKLYPKTPSPHLLRDHDRKYVSVDVYVFRHPLHSTTTIEGYYRIDGVPVGKMTVHATHPRVSASATPPATIAQNGKGVVVEVEANTVKRVDIVLEHILYQPPPVPDAGPVPKLR